MTMMRRCGGSTNDAILKTVGVLDQDRNVVVLTDDAMLLLVK